MNKNKPPPPIVSGAKPILGHALEFQKDRSSLIRRGYEEFGSVFCIKLANQRVAVLIDPDLHKQFYMETDKKLGIEKPYRFLRPLFGDVLFMAPHETYLEQRPFVIQAFRREKMVHYIKVMQQQVQLWLDDLGTAGEIEIVAELGHLTQCVAGYAFMGDDFQQQVGEEFWRLYEDLGKSIDLILPPNWPLPKFIKRDRAKARMLKILQPVIKERRAYPDKYDDFLQDFVNQRYKDGRLIEDDVLLGLMLGLMFAGHETTAGQAAWTIIQLLQNQDYLTLVQDEIEQSVPNGEMIEPRGMAKLKHISWAVRETERTRPSAELNMRTVEESLDVGDYLVPKGWLVQTDAGLAHQLPSLWKNPQKFDPLRFAPDRKEDKQHRFSLIGFGGGIHKCTGMNFANNEMIIITALLFQQFDLELITQSPTIIRGVGANKPSETWIRYKRKPDSQ